MHIEINSIITLDEKEHYIVLKELSYEDRTYFLLMGLDENKKVDASKIEIVYEVTLADGIFVETLKNLELSKILMQMFKEQV